MMLLQVFSHSEGLTLNLLLCLKSLCFPSLEASYRVLRIAPKSLVVLWITLLASFIPDGLFQRILGFKPKGLEAI